MKSKIRSLFLAVALLGICTVSSFATVDDDVAQIRAILSNSTTGQSALYSQVANIYTRINYYLPSLSTIATNTGNINTALSTTNNSLSSINSNFITSNTYLSNIQSYSSTSASNTSSILSGLSAYLPNIHDSVVQLQEVLASDEDLAIRQGQAQRVDQINDDFLDSSGSASVSLGDLGSAKDSVSEIKGAMSGGASASSLWAVLSSGSSSWSWFSQETANDLDSTGSGNRSRSNGSQYSYLQAYYDELGLSLGGDYND